MISKNERSSPIEKRLRLALADSLKGTWNISEPFSRDWVEGQTAIRTDGEWWIYFDHYRKAQHYGAIKTKDWRSFEDETDPVTFPPGQRHGTAVAIDETLARVLQAQKR